MKKFKLTFYNIISPAGKVPQKGHFRLVFLSDLHNIEFGSCNESLLDSIASLHPDGVLIGGDQIVAKPGKALDPGLETAIRLSESYPVYYACGNHEYRLKLYPEVYQNAYQEFWERIEESRITYLENEFADTIWNGCPVRICGFEMKREYYDRFYRGTLPVMELTEAFGQPDPKRYTILLAHHPGYQSTYFSYGADLTLSGHYHGGVVNIGLHRGLVSPDFRIFPEYCRGIYHREHRCHIISAGIGEHTIPVRIHNPRELVVVDVTSKQ
ncbi:MAG: metallophosphoesterase [Fusicatenibacter sp.]|nr:metallophosphoesterase [Fusicatenibacter sp.]